MRVYDIIYVVQYTLFLFKEGNYYDSAHTAHGLELMEHLRKKHRRKSY